MAETVVIDFDFGSAINQINTLNKTIAQLRKEQDALKKAIDSGRTMEVFGISVEEANKQLIQNNLAIKANTKEQQALARTYQASNKELNAAVGSIERNRAELSRLKAEYIKLANPTEAQTKAIKDLNDRLKEQEAAIGVTSRNVGNYEEAITNSLKGIRLFGQDIGVVIENLKAKKAELVVVKNSLLGFGKGVSAGTKALQLFKVALASTGIGLLIVALASLISYLTFTQRGLDTVKIAVDAMSVAFDVIIDRVSRFGEGLFKILSGDLKGGINDLKSSFQGIGDELEREVTQSVELTKALQDLEDQEISLIEVNAERRKQISELRIVAKDEQNDINDRKKALEEAIALEKQILVDQLNIAKERARISQERLDQGESTREEIRENAELQAEVARLEEETNKKLLTLQSEKNSLFNKGKRQEIALTKEAEKAAEDAADAAIAAAEAEQKAREKAFEQDKLRIQEKYNNEIIAAENNKAEIERIEEEKNKALLDRTREFLEEQIQIIDSTLNPAFASADGAFGLGQLILSPEEEEALTERLQELKTQLSEVGVAYKSITQAGEDEEEQTKLQQLLGLDDEGTEILFESIGAVRAGLQGLGDFASTIINNRIADLDKEKQAAIKSAEERGQDTSKIEAKFDKEREKLEKKAFRTKKALAIVDAVINTALAVTSALNTQPFLPLGPIMAGVAGALGAIQIATISAQKFALGGKVNKFDDGGSVVTAGGAPHSEGGTKYVGSDGNVIEVERGENMYVLKKTASDHINRLSALNQQFGGRSWTGTGKVRFAQTGGQVADGGLVARTISDDVESRIAIEDLLAQTPRPIVEVTEINRVQGNRVQSVEVSEL